MRAKTMSMKLGGPMDSKEIEKRRFEETIKRAMISLESSKPLFVTILPTLAKWFLSGVARSD